MAARARRRCELRKTGEVETLLPSIDTMKAALFLASLCAIAALARGAPLLSAGLVRTPSGVFPAECVHSVPSGATLKRNPATDRLHVRLADGTLHAILPKCEYGARESLPSNYD